MGWASLVKGSKLLFSSPVKVAGWGALGYSFLKYNESDQGFLRSIGDLSVGSRNMDRYFGPKDQSNPQNPSTSVSQSVPPDYENGIPGQDTTQIYSPSLNAQQNSGMGDLFTDLFNGIGSIFTNGGKGISTLSLIGGILMMFSGKGMLKKLLGVGLLIGGLTAMMKSNTPTIGYNIQNQNQLAQSNDNVQSNSNTIEDQIRQATSQEFDNQRETSVRITRSA